MKTYVLLLLAALTNSAFASPLIERTALALLRENVDHLALVTTNDNQPQTLREALAMDGAQIRTSHVCRPSSGQTYERSGTYRCTLIMFDLERENDVQQLTYSMTLVNSRGTRDYYFAPDQRQVYFEYLSFEKWTPPSH